MTAALVRICRDFDAAEDALQEALAAAAKQWVATGVPPNPGGWIMTTARRRLIDHLRRTSTGAAKERLALESSAAVPPDDRLTLIFTCCHPAISLENRVALTLRTICGLTTEEIAAAFLVSAETMSKRLVRAKSKIRDGGIAYEVPDPDGWEPRMASVLATIYLVFNRGYDLGSSDRRGIELSEQAIELGRVLDLLVPNEPEIEGLLALMLFTHSRASARFDENGEIVLLADQDRDRWDQTLIQQALRLVSAAAGHGSVGQYWIQAAISAEHTAASTAEATNWAAVVSLYDRLLEQTAQSPVVQLNRALAVAEVSGPQAALELVANLDRELVGYPFLPAARADLYRRAGNDELAAIEYEKAIDLTPEGAQQTSLRRALAEVR